MTAGPSGSLWLSWRRSGYVRRVTPGDRAERRARGGRDEAVGLAVDRRASGRQPAERGADAGLLGERLRAEAERRRVLVQRVREVALADGRVARQQRAVEVVRDASSVGATEPSTRATARFQPGTVESRAGALRTRASGSGRGGSATA